MMDFLVREVRNVTSGPLLIVRFGTCGGLAADVDVDEDVDMEIETAIATDAVNLTHWQDDVHLLGRDLSMLDLLLPRATENTGKPDSSRKKPPARIQTCKAEVMCSMAL